MIGFFLGKWNTSKAEITCDVVERKGGGESKQSVTIRFSRCIRVLVSVNCLFLSSWKLLTGIPL